MIVLMFVAGVCGVLQLAALGSFARSLRVTTLLLLVMVGGYVCAPVALLLELGITRCWHAVTSAPLASVVTLASWTTDPAVEELVKVAPVILLPVLARGLSSQLGLTDHLLIGSAVGGGFSIAEAVMRYSSAVTSAVPDEAGGYYIPVNLAVPHIPGLLRSATSWLPAPVESGWDVLLTGGTGLNLHLLYTGLAALGIGVIARRQGRERLLGVLPLILVCLDHAASNALAAGSVSGRPWEVLRGLEHARSLLPVVILSALLLAVALDRRGLAHPGGGGPRSAAARAELRPLGRFALVSPPLTTAVAFRTVLLRRASRYSVAVQGPDQARIEELQTIDRLILSANDRWRWAAARAELGNRLRGRRAFRERLRAVLWVGLALPPLLYLVVGGVPATAELQGVLQNSGRYWCFGTAVAAVGYGGWHVVVLTRHVRLRPALCWLEPSIRMGSRLLASTAALLAGVATLALWCRAGAGDQRLVRNDHVLDAASALLVMAALLLLVAALLVLFPPGGLLLAAEGGGAVLAAAVSVGTIARLGVALGLSGALLMSAASSGGGRAGARGGSGGTPRGNIRQNTQFRAAVREGERRIGRKLDKDDRERLHLEISKRHLSYHDIVDLIEDFFG